MRKNGKDDEIEKNERNGMTRETGIERGRGREREKERERIHTVTEYNSDVIVKRMRCRDSSE